MSKSCSSCADRRQLRDSPCWENKFGLAIAANLHRLRPQGHGTWQLDQMVVRIGGKRMHMWRAVDAEGEVLDMLLQPAAALKQPRRLLRNPPYSGGR